MRIVICSVAVILWLPMVVTGELPLPIVDLRIAGNPPLLTAWASAAGKTAIRLEVLEPSELTGEAYQVDGGVVIPINRSINLPPVKPGSNLLEIPLPEKSDHGKVLFKIASSPDGKLIANLIVDILPADAWDSLSKQAKEGKVSIDPTLKVFWAWADSHGIPSTQVQPDRPVEYCFWKPAGNSNAPPPGRFIIFERDAPDAFPVIEVLTSPDVTKILLPPGFLASLPDSATAQALLLKHLKLLP